MRPVIIYSTCHNSLLTAPDGTIINERLVSRLIAEGIRDALTPRIEMVDSSAAPRDNWASANVTSERMLRDGLLPIVIECHVNSFPGEHVAYGHLLEHHKDSKQERDLCLLLDQRFEDLIPPYHGVAIIGQPSPGYPNKAFFSHVFVPAVLIETGFVQDDQYMMWIRAREHQLRIGWTIVDAVLEWASQLSAPLAVQDDIPMVGHVII